MELEQHSLFTTKIEEEYIQLDNGLFELRPVHTKYSLYLGEFEADNNQLHEILHTLKTQTPKTLEIFISSNGGLLSEGRKLHNIIENHFPNAVDTYLESHGYSMGALIFCLGNRRIAYENSDIMFHSYSGGAIGKGHEIQAQTSHLHKLFNKYNKTILKDFFSKKELKQLINGKDFWFDVKEMCKRNICTHVMVNGELIKAKDYLKGGK